MKSQDSNSAYPLKKQNGYNPHEV
jgi:serine/threonine protein kinase